jgi:hypothetical protein
MTAKAAALDSDAVNEARPLFDRAHRCLSTLAIVAPAEPVKKPMTKSKAMTKRARSKDTSVLDE